jgi:glycosyltransferase involved in cell wall biosynthesis
MNILYISSKKRWGGVASWMKKTAFGLEKKGHKVYIISHPKLNLGSASESLKITYRKLGFEYNILTILFLVRFIKKKNINIIVTNIEKEVGIGGIAAKLCGIPNIRRVGREDDFNTKFKNRWNHNHLVSKSIVPCNYITNVVVKRAPWLSVDNFTTIYNGRDSVEFDKDIIHQKRLSWAVKEHELVIGVTSQLVAVKRIDLLITVFSRLFIKYKFLKLVITGKGKELDNLKQLVHDLEIEKQVIFPGFTNEPALFASCYDIAVLNSRLEGFPNSIVEYMASGRPVVSTNVGGVSEIIEDGVNGSLVTIDDEDDLYNKLEQLITDSDLRKKYSQNAKSVIRDRFSEENMINSLEAFFKAEISG